jgi:hypothetical protein
MWYLRPVCMTAPPLLWNHRRERYRSLSYRRLAQAVAGDAHMLRLPAQESESKSGRVFTLMEWGR